MTYNNIFEVQEAILQAFGLNDGQKNITEMHLHLNGGNTLPKLEVTRVVLQPPHFAHTFETREVTSTKPKQFDLDALCTRARMAVHNHIDHAARDALHHIARGFLDARIACGLPLRERDKRHMTDAELDMFYQYLPITGIEALLAFKRPFDAYRFTTESTTP